MNSVDQAATAAMCCVVIILLPVTTPLATHGGISWRPFKNSLVYLDKPIGLAPQDGYYYLVQSTAATLEIRKFSAYLQGFGPPRSCRVHAASELNRTATIFGHPNSNNRESLVHLFRRLDDTSRPYAAHPFTCLSGRIPPILRVAWTLTGNIYDRDLRQMAIARRFRLSMQPYIVWSGLARR